ncbi:MAG: NUDIX hydrolase [Chloroflexota bacterium]
MSDSLPERVVARREVFRGRILSLRVDEVVLPSARRTTREIVEHPGAVVIVAPDDRRRVAMVRQYRAAIGQVLIELPAGTREPNEDAEACARRELAEEMGLEAASWTALGGFYSAPGFCTEYLSLFLATGLAPAPGRPEEDESIQREWIELRDVPTLIASGEIRDAKSIVGLLRYLSAMKTGD